MQRRGYNGYHAGACEIGAGMKRMETHRGIITFVQQCLQVRWLDEHSRTGGQFHSVVIGSVVNVNYYANPTEKETKIPHAGKQASEPAMSKQASKQACKHQKYCSKIISASSQQWRSSITFRPKGLQLLNFHKQQSYAKRRHLVVVDLAVCSAHDTLDCFAHAADGGHTNAVRHSLCRPSKRILTYFDTLLF